MNNCSSDCSEFHRMTTEELYAFLHSQADHPDELQPDKLVCALEVYAARVKDQIPPPPRTAEEVVSAAFASDSAAEAAPHTDPVLEAAQAQPIEPMPRAKRDSRIFRKVASVAAAVAISFTLLTVTAYAAGIPLWSAVIEWTQQTLRFVWEDELTPGDASLILQKYGVTEDGVPGWIPEGYALADFVTAETDVGLRHTVGYTQENNTVIFSVSPYNKNSNHQFHQSGETETYDANGIRYYIVPNLKRMVAVWMESGCECKISGEFTKETLKDILDQMN